MNLKRFICVCLTALLFFPSVVRAEKAFDLGEIVVTASRMVQDDAQVSSDVTVIDQAQIQSSSAQTVNEILAEESGIMLFDTGSAKTAVVDLRGFGDTASRNVLVLVNNRKVNAMDISGPDLLQIPLGSVERIEVVRGAGSVLYGDNAVAGVINIITKKGKGKMSGRLTGTYGNYNTSSEAAELSGEKKGLSYYFYTKNYDTKGYRSNSALVAQDYNAQLDYALADNLLAKVIGSWHDDRNGLPGGLTEAEMASLGRRGSADEQDFAKTKDRFIQLSLEADPWGAAKEKGYLVTDISFRRRNGYDSFNTYGAYNTERTIDTSGVAAKYVYDQSIFGREVNVVTGVDYYDSQNDILGSGGNVDDITISKNEVGGYGRLEFELVDHIFLNGGGRYHQARYDFNQRNVPVEESQTPSVWVYEGGMKYAYAEKSNAYFNIQKTFRFLSTDEWYSTANYPGWGITPGLNLDLKQQTGMQYEAGVRHNLFDVTDLKLTTYLMDNRNEIFFDPVTFANSNYDKTRRIGLEVGQDTDLMRLWSIEDRTFLTACRIPTSYTYQDPEFDGGSYDGKRIPFVPTHQLSQGLELEFKNHYQFSVVGRYVGSRPDRASP